MGRKRLPSPPAELIGAMFEAAADASRWPEVVESITSWTGGLVGGLQIRRLSRVLETTLFSSGAPEFHQAYVEHYYKLDPHLASAGVLREGETMLSREVLPDDVLHRTPYFNELCRAHDLGDLQGAMLLRNDALMVTFAAWGPDAHRFDETTRRRLDALVPHLTRAVGLALELDEQRQLRASLGGAAEARHLGVLRVDASLNILHASVEVATWLDTGAGPLALRQRRLAVGDDASEVRLRTAVTEAIAGASTWICVGLPADTLSVLVAPAPASLLSPTPSAQLLFMLPPDNLSTFALPPALQPVASLLADGLSTRRSPPSSASMPRRLVPTWPASSATSAPTAAATSCASGGGETPRARLFGAIAMSF